MANNRRVKIHQLQTYPLLRARERLLVWRKAKGMWSNRKPDAEELKQIRKEWDRAYPPLPKLVDIEGKAIGVNTAMVMGAQNIGFAIPINYAKKDVEEVKEVITRL